MITKCYDEDECLLSTFELFLNQSIISLYPLHTTMPIFGGSGSGLRIKLHEFAKHDGK